MTCAIFWKGLFPPCSRQKFHSWSPARASRAHGLPRATQDLDIVIAPTGKSLDALLSKLSPDVYYVDVDVARDAFRNHGMFNVIDHATGWKIDFNSERSPIQ